jgi:hypothetical protein
MLRQVGLIPSDGKRASLVPRERTHDEANSHGVFSDSRHDVAPARQPVERLVPIAFDAPDLPSATATQRQEGETA